MTAVKITLGKYVIHIGKKTVAFVCIIMRIKGLVHLEILELNKQKVSILPL
ncbi:hypothetical protein MITSMUL_05145 [Mitsuokella multacida DSM 20544]|uniref:Uncharacterized protein n=1 Tax=Mitsuokella multacida DSM 20544 TaxID=500635 RepID=C9KPI8_9FIRM|nr:hypothetical protein MITSMUL_05145 [Mitsuokella multacida DSM 20544]